MGFISFLLSRDMLGHQISINYKGNPTYNTKFGAFLSIGIQVLVLFQLIQLSIDMVSMNDPTIISYNRPLYKEEIADFDLIELDEYRWTFGVYFTNSDNPNIPIELPAEIGRIVSVQQVKDQSRGHFETSLIPAVNCTDLFTHVNMNLT